MVRTPEKRWSESETQTLLKPQVRFAGSPQQDGAAAVYCGESLVLIGGEPNPTKVCHRPSYGSWSCTANPRNLFYLEINEGPSWKEDRVMPIL